MEAAHLHVWSVHLPLLATAGMALLLVAYYLTGRRVSVAVCAFGIGLAGSAFTPLVMGSGEEAYETYQLAADTATFAHDSGFRESLERHESYAHNSGKLFYLVILASLGGLLIAWKRPGWLTWAVRANLLLAVIAVTVNLTAAKTGGEIRRPEFRASWTGTIPDPE